MPGYNSRPPVKRSIPVAKRIYRMGTPCPICKLTRPAGWVGRCRSCLDARDAEKGWEE